MNSPRMPLSGMLPSAASSTPATPTGTRRATQPQPHMPLAGLGVDVYGNRRVILNDRLHLRNLQLVIGEKASNNKVAGDKGISETKSKQQRPCSNCMHQPVTS